MMFHTILTKISIPVSHFTQMSNFGPTMMVLLCLCLPLISLACPWFTVWSVSVSYCSWPSESLDLPSENSTRVYKRSIWKLRSCLQSSYGLTVACFDSICLSLSHFVLSRVLEDQNKHFISPTWIGHIVHWISVISFLSYSSWINV